jgi:hypothetical protein
LVCLTEPDGFCTASIERLPKLLGELRQALRERDLPGKVVMFPEALADIRSNIPIQGDFLRS